MKKLSSQLNEWFNQIPFITRTYLSICAIFTILTWLGLISSYHMAYTFENTFLQFNLWRPITAFFFLDSLNIGSILYFYFAFIALKQIETKVFTDEAYGDFLWMIILNFITCVIVGSFTNLYFFTDPFLISLVCVLCRQLPQKQVSIGLGLKIKTKYFMIIFAIVLIPSGGRFIAYILGVAMGCFYIILKDVATTLFKIDLIPTPRCLKQLNLH